MLTLAADCAPPGLQLHLYAGLGQLPLFNPDLEPAEPAPVVRLQQAIAQADAVLIASPEYAHGVSSVMKNALDWTVASGVFVDKPVVLWNASPRATIALAALHETLAVMSAQLVGAAQLTLLLPSLPVGQEAHTNPDPAAMRKALLALQTHLRA